MTIKNGIDVSKHQGVIDWSKVKKAGVEFAVIRATAIRDKVDSQFYNNIRGCEENDIPFDVYKYVYATTPAAAKEEIREVCELLRENDIFCTVWYDIEDKTVRALGKDAITELVKAAEEVVSEYGFPFGIYCNKDWYNNVIDSSAFDNEFWIARYPSSAIVDFDDAPAEDEVSMEIMQDLFGWQWSSKGRISGISGYVDMDVIYLGAEDHGIQDENEESTVQNQNPYREPTYTLYRGRLAMDKEFVKWLQYNLVRAGYMDWYYTAEDGEVKDSVDGLYGWRTDAAVEKFQKDHPETYSTAKPDKRVGPKTRAALKFLNA